MKVLHDVERQRGLSWVTVFYFYFYLLLFMFIINSYYYC